MSFLDDFSHLIGTDSSQGAIGALGKSIADVPILNTGVQVLGAIYGGPAGAAAASAAMGRAQGRDWGQVLPNAAGAAALSWGANNIMQSGTAAGASGAEQAAVQDLVKQGYSESAAWQAVNEGAGGVTSTFGTGNIPGGVMGAWQQAGDMVSPVTNWMGDAYNSMLGPGTALGGKAGMTMGANGTGWLGPLMSVGSGLYGLSLAEEQRKLAQQAIAGSSPWTTSGGAAGAGAALTNVINGDFTNDAGFTAAQMAAARTSAQQPGGFAAQAAAQAALKYQNDRIAALSGPAGVGFSPAAGYQTAVQGTASANYLASSSLGSIGFGLTGAGNSMPPWLQQYLIQNGMGK